MNELTYGAPWTASGARIVVPPVRVAVDGNRLACTIGLLGKGQSVPTPLVKAGTELPEVEETYLETERPGQRTITGTFVSIFPDGRHVPLLALRISGFERDLRAEEPACFELTFNVVHRREEDGTVVGWMQLTLTTESQDERVVVESFDPAAGPGTAYEGIVRSEVGVPVADIVLSEEARHLRNRVRLREPFTLQLDDGRRLTVDCSDAPLDELETHTTRGRWKDVHQSFAALFVSHEMKARSGDAHTEFVLAERTVCAGDRVVVRGELRGATRIEAIDIEMVAPVERSRSLLSASERETYRLDEPLTRAAPPASEERRGGAASRYERETRTRLIIAGFVVLTLVFALRIFVYRDETNTFTRIVDAFLALGG